MKRLVALFLIAALPACGSSDSGTDGPGSAHAGEIQALANAEAMLETREDEPDRSPAQEMPGE